MHIKSYTWFQAVARLSLLPCHDPPPDASHWICRKAESWGRWAETKSHDSTRCALLQVSYNNEIGPKGAHVFLNSRLPSPYLNKILREATMGSYMLQSPFPPGWLGTDHIGTPMPDLLLCSAPEGNLAFSVGTSQNITSRAYQKAASFPSPGRQPKASFCWKADPGVTAPSRTQPEQEGMTNTLRKLLEQPQCGRSSSNAGAPLRWTMYPTEFRDQLKEEQPHNSVHWVRQQIWTTELTQHSASLESSSRCTLCQRPGWTGKREGRKF